MNKHILKPTIGVLFAAFALVFSFTAFLAMNKSVAWFAKNDTVNVGGMILRVADGDAAGITVTCYGVTAITEDALGNQYTSDSVIRNEISLYDPEQIEDTKYKPALILQLDYEVQGGEMGNLAANCNPTYTLEEQIKPLQEKLILDNNFLSNIIRFRAATKYVDEERTYYVPTPVSTDRVFISGSAESGFAKAPSVSLANGLSGTGTLYFIMDYNTDVVEYICDNRESDAENVLYQADVTLMLGGAGA